MNETLYQTILTVYSEAKGGLIPSRFGNFNHPSLLEALKTQVTTPRGHLSYEEAVYDSRGSVVVYQIELYADGSSNAWVCRRGEAKFFSKSEIEARNDVPARLVAMMDAVKTGREALAAAFLAEALK
jgi:hypothetical protein